LGAYFHARDSHESILWGNEISFGFTHTRSVVP
jgi:hypothetical protein